MKKALMITSALFLNLQVRAETTFEYDITKVPGEKIAISPGRLALKIKGTSSPIPPIRFDVPSSMLIRLVGAKVENEKAAVVLQFDDFNLEYREYSIKSNEWTMTRRNRICDLNGPLSDRLKKVTITKLGELEIRFGRTVSGDPRHLKWEDAVLQGAFADENDDIVEGYSLKDDGKNVRTGKGNPFRPRGKE